MKKWLPALVTLVVTVVGALVEPIQAAIVAHPSVAVIVGGVYAIAKLLVPSPLGKESTL